MQIVCRVSYKPAELFGILTALWKYIINLYRGRGCERCKNSGYSGRMAIIEAMTVTDEIRKLIIARANTREMGKIAIGQGMRTLRMIALDRARESASTLEQVLLLTAAH